MTTTKTRDANGYELIRRMPMTGSSFPSYEARHPRRPGRFVLQVLTGARDCGDALDEFERGTAAIASIRHPYILDVIEISGLSDGTPIVVSELPAGGTLEDWLVAGKIASAQGAAKLIISVAEALSAAHARGVVHGALGADDLCLIESAGSATLVEGGGGLGLPKLRGLGLATLRARCRDAVELESATAPGADVDVIALAKLAERLLAPPSLADGQWQEFFLTPRTKAVLDRARGAHGEPFESVLAFANALESAILRDEGVGSTDGAARGWGTGPRVTGRTRKRDGRRRFSPLQTGLVVSAISLVVAGTTGTASRPLRDVPGALYEAVSAQTALARAAITRLGLTRAAGAAVEEQRIAEHAAGNDDERPTPAITPLPSTETAESPEGDLGTVSTTGNSVRGARKDREDGLDVAPPPTTQRLRSGRRPATEHRPSRDVRALRGLVWSPATGELVAADRAGP